MAEAGQSRDAPKVEGSRPKTASGGDTHTPLASHPLAAVAVEAFLAGVAAADPTVLVRKAVRQGLLDDWMESRERPKPLHVLALGKAAPRMLWGLVEAGVPFSGLGVAPKGVAAPGVDTFRWLPGDHPVPGADSFAAGREVMRWCDEVPVGAPVLVLLSGGASAVAEVPLDGSPEELAASWRAWMAEGLPVTQLNARRAQASALKAGRLGRRLLGRTPRIRVWALSDVPPGDLAALGSGPFWQAGEPALVPHRVLADADTLLQGAALRLAVDGWQVHRHPGRLQGATAAQVEAFLDGAGALAQGHDVALLGVGETADPVPEGAPPGGRCQHAVLAAALAMRRRGQDTASVGGVFLAAASDGVDGTTREAGAWATAGDGDPEAEAAFARLDAHTLLASRGRTVRTLPTGTNVNDLWVYLRRAAP